MLNDRSSALSLLETRRSGKPRELVGPGPTAEEMERILTIAARVPDHGKLSPWRFVLVGEDQREAFAKLLRDALAEEEAGSSSAADREGFAVRASSGPARGSGRSPHPGPQDPGVGAGAVGRNGGHEPADRRARAGLCRRLGDRLAGLFAQRSTPPSARKASGSPASSSSAIRAASSRNGRGRRSKRSCGTGSPRNPERISD